MHKAFGIYAALMVLCAILGAATSDPPWSIAGYALLAGASSVLAWRERLRRIAGFIACLFDAHDLEYDLQRDWLECRRCHERRCSYAELLARSPRPARPTTRDLWAPGCGLITVTRYPPPVRR